MARKYTEAVHAKRLLGMLKREEPCECCPAQYRYKKWSLFIKGAGERPNRLACQVCRAFVKIKEGCPCGILGQTKALKRTWEALEAKGYI